MAGFNNDVMYANNVRFDGAEFPGQVTLDGQLLIGSTVAPNIRVGTLTAGAGITITNGSGSIMISATAGSFQITPDVGVAITNPTFTLSAAQVASGVNPIRSNGLAANSLRIEAQRSQATVASTLTANGLSHFDSSMFTVDANGFVQLAGGTLAVDSIGVNAFTAPGTNPVLPTVAGLLNIFGAAVAAAGIPVRSDSLAANTLQIEVQRSTAAVGSLAANAGLASFNSTQFTVDLNGWVNLVGGSSISNVTVDAFTGPGTNPVLPNGAGNMIVTGVAVAAAAIPVRTDSLAANSYRIEVQRADDFVGSLAANAGLASFDNNAFQVDVNGWVQLQGGGRATQSYQPQTGTNPVVPTAAGLLVVNGAAVAPGIVPVQSNGTGANTIEIQVQRSAASALTNVTQQGICSFNSAQFTVDANGWVTFSGSTTTPWLDIAGGALAAFTGYFVTAAAAVTLPAAPAQGTLIEIVDEFGGGVVVTSAGGDKIRIGNVTSSSPGTATSTQIGDALRLVYRTVGASWIEVPGSSGNWVLA